MKNKFKFTFKSKKKEELLPPIITYSLDKV